MNGDVVKDPARLRFQVKPIKIVMVGFHHLV